MTRLAWGDISERFYETGVDRGVLYAPSQSGVAWNGLISVSETPTGSEPRPFYFDGIKYANVATSEEYEATIEAFGSPAEFRVCEGVVAIHNGLFATQQPRQSFGLSYRTLIGDVLAGDSRGYKIHLVYNALAEPSQRSNKSQGSSSELTKYSWHITTLPPAATGIKRTAHFIVDSRYADSGALSDLEDILYGTVSEDASLPDPDDLIAIFA